MARGVAKPVLRNLVTAFLALCVVALGFAPHASQPAAPSSQAALAAAAGIDLSLYALPDGTLPDLCLTLHGDEAGGHEGHQSPHCPVCTLAKSLIAPAPEAIATAFAYAKAYPAPALDSAALPRARPGAHRARGPPAPALA